VTLDALYAARYGLGTKPVYECRSQETCFLVCGRAVYSDVYPVTQANNESPLRPALKGKRIGEPKLGTKGCDGHFVCVKGVPPHNPDKEGDALVVPRIWDPEASTWACGEKNWTFHPCFPGERAEATELVLNEDDQLLPEFIVEVQVTSDVDLLTRMKHVFEEMGRAPRTSQASGFGWELAARLGLSTKELCRNDYISTAADADRQYKCPKCSRVCDSDRGMLQHWSTGKCRAMCSRGEDSWLDEDWAEVVPRDSPSVARESASVLGTTPGFLPPTNCFVGVMNFCMFESCRFQARG